ncbi:molybdopterin molybdotransferase MoeA [Sphingomonas sp.]|uniref:molybdopterin molybdotransferase MoeA n=1 Tax=Sphingomonas sp. TaxID=28214 RepID=UPI003D6D82C2
MVDLGFAIRPMPACHATLGFDEALARMEHATQPLGREQVALPNAAGRILAEPVLARVNAPPVDVAAMDGYAVRDGAFGPLHVIGESAPAHPCRDEVGADRAVRIFTGAPMPGGAERVIPQELADRQGDLVTVPLSEDKRHVRLRGSDFAAGEPMLPANRRLDPRAMLVAAAADAAQLVVWRAPRIFVVATGDELVRSGQAATGSPFVIPDSISPAIAALAIEWGAVVAGSALVPDRLDVIERCVQDAMASADVVVVIGGASVGDRDFSKTALATLGLGLVFSKVAIKPGKPVWYGRAGATHILGLPGNPTAALVTARLFLAPLLCRLTGRPMSAALSWRPAQLAVALDGNGDREAFLCGAWDGRAARALDRQAASSQALLALTNILIRRVPGVEAEPIGSITAVLDF